MMHRIISRRQMLRGCLAAPAAAWLGWPAVAAAAPRLDGDFTGGCCVFEGEKNGALLCRPAAPPDTSGNLWFRFTARLSGARGPQAIELHWPANSAASAKNEYGGNQNFATVLNRAVNVSHDLRHWTPVESVQVEGQVARFTVDAGSGEPLYVAAGLPYFAHDLEALITECRGTGLAEITEIAMTAGGHPVPAVRIGPKGNGAGSFYLQAQQHATEWAGSRILGSMTRHLLSDAGGPLRERFVWHLVPVMNVGSLYGQNPAGNMNRDWATFKMLETVGARDYIKKIIAGGGRLLHGIDLHMGWSSRKSSGACMTAMRKGAAPDAIIARQEAFAKHTFANCDWTQEKIWLSEHKDGIPFYHWAVKELGVAMQTAEFSRHIVWERTRQEWGRLRQEHEERLGVQFAQALASFNWSR